MDVSSDPFHDTPEHPADARIAAHPPAVQAVLSRDLSQFLVDFSIALHRQAMYPPGHPTLVPTLQSLVRRAEALLDGRARFAIGVARDRLVIDGVVTDVKHPLLRGLADRMHRHQLGAIAFIRGLTTAEIVSLLAALAADPDGIDGPLGDVGEKRLTQWPHVRAYSMRLDRLDIVDAAGHPAEGSVKNAGHRCAQLWVGLAHAAMDGSTTTVEATAISEPSAVAHAIDEHERVEAYDQVIVGYLQQIAEELRAAGGADALELRKRTSRLVSAMRPETLRRLLAMGGDALQRQRFLKDAATSMTAGAVVDLVRAAAESTQESISNGFVRMLSKLAAHADAGPDTSRELAEAALRDQVQQLLTGWELSDPNPVEYTRVLHRISSSAPPPRPDDGRSPQPPCDSIRLVEMSLELDEDAPILWRAVNDLIERGQAAAVAAVVAPLRGSGALPDRLWTYLTSPVALSRMLRVVPADLAGLDAVLQDLSSEALTPLFDLLAETEDRALRRALLERLRQRADVSAPLAVERLADDRWYVLRNLLHLLSGMDGLPAGLDPRPHLVNPDARVRREALRLALRLDAHRAAAVEAALSDEDASVLGLALTAARSRCPRAAVPRLLDLARHEGLAEDLQAHALRALLAAGRPPGLLDILLRLAARGLARSRDGVSAGEAALAALAGLASEWRGDPRAAELVTRAARSGDPEVRRAVRDVA